MCPANVSLAALVFALLALLLSQVPRTAGAAAGLAGALMALAWLMDGAISVANAGWLGRLSPLFLDGSGDQAEGEISPSVEEPGHGSPRCPRARGKTASPVSSTLLKRPPRAGREPERRVSSRDPSILNAMAPAPVASTGSVVTNSAPPPVYARRPLPQRDRLCHDGHGRGSQVVTHA